MRSWENTVELLWRYCCESVTAEEVREVESLFESHRGSQEMARFLKEFRRDSGHPNSQKLSSAASRLARDAIRAFLAGAGEEAPHRGIPVFDSALLPAPEGARPSGLDCRRLRYKMNEWEVDLASYPLTPDSAELMGFVSGPLVGGRLKVRLHNDHSDFCVEALADRSFRLQRVPVAKYRLLISDGDDPIGLIEVEL